MAGEVWKCPHNVMAACEWHAVPRLICIGSANLVFAGSDIEGGRVPPLRDGIPVPLCGQQDHG